MILRKKSRISFLGKAALLSILVLFIFAIIAVRSSVVTLEYQLSSLEAKKKDLMKDAKVLSADRARLFAVKRFENVAAAGGMVFPDRMKVVYVKNARKGGAYTASLVPTAGRGAVAKD
ncbi:MAG TPA: hypothetical protein VK445_03195 [Dissulfurispiraceae bacterium]|nr:hypothetical protein [Dissulfurispiraceae bacterium]